MFELRNIREIRQDSFTKQKELAEKIGIKVDAYAKYEQGKSIPSLKTIFNYAKFYNLNIDYILGLEEKRSYSNYDTYNKKLIANNLKVLRLRRNLSQRGLAIKIGITQAAIQRYESSLSNPSLKTLFKYYKFFNFSFNDLVTKDFNLLYNKEKK